MHFGELDTRKLLPGNPDPRVNLAITLERAVRFDDAFKTYEAALEVAPECMAANEGAAALSVRAGRNDERLAKWIDQIALDPADPSWASWARERIAQKPGR